MALNWFKKLKSGLSKSASKVEGAIASITGKKTLDQETLDNIEDQLILADLGIEVAARITKKIKDQKFEIKDKKIHKIKNPNFTLNRIKGGSVGFAESYMKNEFETKNLSDLIEVTARNIQQIHKFSGLFDLPLINFFKNIFVKNTKNLS